MRLLAALELYELGRLSSGRAAELAGIPRVEFLLTLGRYKVFPLEAELRDLEADRATGD
jgi:predicted HTH domain antitoxin